MRILKVVDKVGTYMYMCKIILNGVLTRGVMERGKISKLFTLF